MEIITRAAAKAAGLTTYFTGAPCCKGHIAIRTVANFGCTVCSAAVQKNRYAQKATDENFVEANRARARAWRERNLDRAKATQKKWRNNTVEQRAQYHRDWRRNNPEDCRRLRKEWAKKNPEKVIASRAARLHRRRAKLKEAGGSYSVQDIEALHRKQKGRCAECGQKRKLTVDHKVPIKRGGTNHISNIQLLCMPCNSRKGAKDPLAWAQENGRLL